MTDPDSILQLGIEAAREGNNEEARNLFRLLTRQNNHDVRAWLWLAGVAENRDERRAALERVIEIAPTNDLALRGLQSLGAKPTTKLAEEVETQSEAHLSHASPKPVSPLAESPSLSAPTTLAEAEEDDDPFADLSAAFVSSPKAVRREPSPETEFDADDPFADLSAAFDQSPGSVRRTKDGESEARSSSPAKKAPPPKPKTPGKASSSSAKSAAKDGPKVTIPAFFAKLWPKKAPSPTKASSTTKQAPSPTKASSMAKQAPAPKAKLPKQPLQKEKGNPSQFDVKKLTPVFIIILGVLLIIVLAISVVPLVGGVLKANKAVPSATSSANNQQTNDKVTPTPTLTPTEEKVVNLDAVATPLGEAEVVQPTSGPTPVPPPPPAAQPLDLANANPSILPANTPLESNGWLYDFNNPSHANVVYTPLAGKSAQGRFVIIFAMTVNRTGQAQPLPADFLVLKDAQGRVYHPLTWASTAYLNRFGYGSGGNVSQEQSVPADGITYGVPIIFDVAPDATNLVFFAPSKPDQGWLVRGSVR